MTWDEVAERFKTDKAANVGYGHGYMGHYEKLLSGRELKNILEIGVYLGGSLRMWLELFPRAWVYGIDKMPFCSGIVVSDRVQIDIVDAGNAVELTKYASGLPELDLIIDDGSHAAYDIQAALSVLWPKLAVWGIYVIEDVWCSQFEGDVWMGTVRGLRGGLREWAADRRAATEIYPDRQAKLLGGGYSLLVLRKQRADTI